MITIWYREGIWHLRETGRTPIKFLHSDDTPTFCGMPHAWDLQAGPTYSNAVADIRHGKTTPKDGRICATCAASITPDDL